LTDKDLDYFSDVALELDMTSVTTGRDALVVHKLEELEEVIRLKPTKRFKGETSRSLSGPGSVSISRLTGSVDQHRIRRWISPKPR
jgi:hypothetical protein